MTKCLFDKGSRISYAVVEVLMNALISQSAQGGVQMSQVQSLGECPGRKHSHLHPHTYTQLSALPHTEARLTFRNSHWAMPSPCLILRGLEATFGCLQLNNTAPDIQAFQSELVEPWPSLYSTAPFLAGTCLKAFVPAVYT